MLARGHHVTIVVPEDTPLATAAIRMKIPLIPTAIRQKRVTGFVSIHRWLAGAKLRTDVINTHSSTDSWLTAVACAAVRNAPPVVRTRHVSTVVNRNATTRWLYSQAARHIVTTGESLRRQLASQLCLPLDRLTSVPTGIDLSHFVPGDPDAARRQLGLRRRRTLGSVATLRDWKGHDYLFEAIALDREGWEDWDVIIVGDGPHRQKLEARVASLQLGNIVRFVGQQENVVPWFQALDLFTLPSYAEEGAPQAIMQAMACSIPVVSTPVGAISEVVSHELTGLLVTAKSPAALAQGLSRLRDDPACRTRFGAMGRARARRDFGIDRMLDRMEDVFYRVSAAK